MDASRIVISVNGSSHGNGLVRAGGGKMTPAAAATDSYNGISESNGSGGRTRSPPAHPQHPPPYSPTLAIDREVRQKRIAQLKQQTTEINGKGGSSMSGGLSRYGASTGGSGYDPTKPVGYTSNYRQFTALD